MNEKLQYATMLEIPVNTCNVTFQPSKKRKATSKKDVNPDTVKEELMNKINAEEYPLEQPESENFVQQNYPNDQDGFCYSGVSEVETYQPPVNQKKRFNIGSIKLSVIGIQLVVIGVLVATIFLTNVFFADSGINVFMRQMFGGNEQTVEVDDRNYSEFAPVIAVDADMTTSLEKGVISFAGKGSVYAPCDGKVTAITQGEDGKFSVEISHSDNFKTTLKGLDYAYADLEQEVYFNIPVGYMSADGATMCFTGADGSVISDYEIVDSSVIWAV